MKATYEIKHYVRCILSFVIKRWVLMNTKL